jgi:hypothetical protein
MTPRPGRAASVTVAVVLLAGCTFADVPTPRPRATPTATAMPSPTPVPSTPSPTPIPTPDLGAIPAFAAGELIASRINGLRVRQRPGFDAAIATGLLPFDARLEVVMGPFVVDGLGWYLVTDADPDEPQFEEGWVAAGAEPEAFLASTGEIADPSPFVGSLAGSGDAEEGPIEIGDGAHAIRWIAGDPDGVGCRFAVSLQPAGGDPVATIRATVGAGIDRGTLQPQTFDALEVRGPAFVAVASDCAWALVILRAADPNATPDPSASPTPG